MDEDKKQQSKDPDEKPDSDKKTPAPARSTRKVGEPPENLQDREEWFRKRSGN